MDDEPMWAAYHVVAPKPGSTITIPETANKFAIKAYQLLEDKVLLKLDWAKNQKAKTSLKKTVAFADEGSSNSNTDKIMARMDAMTLKMDAQYKELLNHAKKTKPDEDDIPISREEKARFMQTFCKTRFYNDYRDRDSNRDNWRSNERSSYNRDNYRSSTDDKPYDLQKQFNDFMKSQQSTNAFVKETFMDLKTVAKNHQESIQNLETKFDRLADKQSGRPSRSLPSNTQSNPKGHNSKTYQPSQSRNEHVNVIFTRSADLGASINLMPHSLYAKLSLENLKPTKMSVRLADISFQYPIGIAKNMLVEVEGFDALLDEGSRILNSIEGTLLKEEIFAEFDEFIAMTANENYDSESDIEDPPPIHCVLKKGGITVVTNENDELVPTRTVTGWRVCIDYRKLNEATAKDHFPLPFMDQ
ncbi:reverse transcriptase domain-containing protein, partial [Tanacetum coccineum]